MQPGIGAVARYFLRLGLIGFGGPPAHIALMRRELVDQRGWIDVETFNADLATSNLLPGPTSTELAIYLGYRLHGIAGAFVAGLLFILPAFVFVLALAIGYTQGIAAAWIDTLLYAIRPVALALMVNGVLALGKPITADWRQCVVFGAALVAILLTQLDVLIVLLLGGTLLLALHGRTMRGLPIITISTLPAATTGVGAAAILLVFLQIGIVIYGGGFALAGILQQRVVDDLGWMSQRELLDGIAIGQSTPGPVFTTATFVGYLVGGWPGAIAATIGIFAPAFALVLIESRLLGWLKRWPSVRLFLSGINAAVVASLVVAIAQLGRSALPDVAALLIGVAAFIALSWKRIDAHWLVGIAVLIGLARLALV